MFTHTRQLWLRNVPPQRWLRWRLKRQVEKKRMLCGDLFLRLNGLVEGKAYQKKTYDLASNLWGFPADFPFNHSWILCLAAELCRPSVFSRKRQNLTLSGRWCPPGGSACLSPQHRYWSSIGHLGHSRILWYVVYSLVVSGFNVLFCMFHPI